MELFIGERCSGKTTRCITEAEKYNNAGILVTYTPHKKYIMGKQCPTCGRVPRTRVHAVGDDLSGIDVLVIDELPTVLKELLWKYMNFHGALVFGTICGVENECVKSDVTYTRKE